MKPAPPVPHRIVTIRAEHPAEPLFQNIARHLATQWSAPMAAIVHNGQAGPAILAEIGLTAHARALALAEAARMVQEAADTRVHDLPDCTIRFLGAAPLTDTAGQCIGALIVLDDRPRRAEPRAIAALSDLATVVSLSLMMQDSHQRLELLAITDPLTGLYNRRGLDLLFARHTNTAMALLAIDIDDFKAVNDTHGHSAGDRALVHVAGILRQSVRVSDIVARTGGDEFLILLPDTPDPAVATQVAARIHETLAASKPSPYPTVSIGIAHTHAPTSVAALKAAADHNLRTAKQCGKARTFPG